MHRIGVRCGPRSSQRALAAAAQINEGAALSPQAPDWADQERWGTTGQGVSGSPGPTRLVCVASAGLPNPPSAPLGVSPWFGMSTPCNIALELSAA